MKWEQAKAKLVRIINAIEQGLAPAAIRELHVFGSYARGALNPTDLDLVVVHDAATPELMRHLEHVAKEKARSFSDELYGAGTRFESMMRKAFRKPGESIDILLASSFEEATKRYAVVRPNETVLLWSIQDRHWQAKLDALKPDATAGRAERVGFLTPKEAGCTRTEMERVTKMLACDMLKMERVELPREAPKLNHTIGHWCDYWLSINTMGAKSAECLPFAMRWLQSRRVTKPQVYVATVCDSRGRYYARIGRMALGWMLWQLGLNQSRAVCLIPHFKRGVKREMFVFERGPRWKADWHRD